MCVTIIWLCGFIVMLQTAYIIYDIYLEHFKYKNKSEVKNIIPIEKEIEAVAILTEQFVEGTAKITINTGPSGYTSNITLTNPLNGQIYHFVNTNKSLIKSLSSVIKECLNLIEQQEEPYL